jgi:hypothetical protein
LFFSEIFFVFEIRGFHFVFPGFRESGLDQNPIRPGSECGKLQSEPDQKFRLLASLCTNAARANVDADL